jgi:hypothetical protein
MSFHATPSWHSTLSGWQSMGVVAKLKANRQKALHLQVSISNGDARTKLPFPSPSAIFHYPLIASQLATTLNGAWPEICHFHATFSESGCG